MAPPGRSRLPVTMLARSASHEAKRAELGGVGADAPVRPRRWAQRRTRGRCVGWWRHRCGCGRPRSPRRTARALRARGPHRRRCSPTSPRSTAPAATDLGDERGEPQRVGAGSDRQVLVGGSGGLRAAGVDGDDAAAALADRRHAAREVRSGAQAAVGLVGVGSQHQQVVGAVQVRHRHRVRVAEQIAAAHVLGHLVHGRGREDVLGAQRLDERAGEHRTGQGVCGGVAQVHRDRVAVAVGPDPSEPLGDGGEGLVPGGLDQHAVTAHQRRAETVRVLVQLAQRGALRADEPVGEHIVAVAADAHDGAVAHGQLEATGGLAQRTGPVVGRLAGHGRPPRSCIDAPA